MIKLRNLLHGLLTLFLMAGCMLLFACKSQPAVLDAPQKTKGANTQTLPPSPSPTPEISYQGPVSRVEGKTFLVRTMDGTFSPFFVKGVDIGAAKPGFWPGEFGIPESDYLRWFQQIGEMYANTIRVYVPQMPEFYQALLTYNRTASQPLYLLQGIYMNESLIETYLDAFNPDLNEIFQRDLKNTIDIIHGHATVEKLPGNAGGTYTADVSQYVIGYLPGIEFSADFVLSTNEKNAEKTTFQGTYVVTSEASPFEVFLAQTQELMIAYEESNYHVQRPIAITNWVTTDPLSHPGEPNPSMEDAVSVDVEHIKATDAYTAGFFASYHVYPYYPDFMSYEQKYLTAEQPDTYRAYLTELNAYHTMPVLIAEFGIPSSRGMTHKNAISGFNQGHVEESVQGAMLVSLMKDIRETDCMGGLIFSWQDEWFKRTWNTKDQEETERRPYWHNVESPEKSFGLLSFDPGESLAVRIDGAVDDWSVQDQIVNASFTLSVKSDEAYLYFLVQPNDASFLTKPIMIAADTIPNQGNLSYQGAKFDRAADFLIVLNGPDNSTMLVDPYYDVFQYQYAVQTSLVDPIEHQTEKNSGAFVPIYAALSRALVLPETGESIPFSKFDAGHLTYGISDPNNAAFHSLSDFYIGETAIEVRIPWMLFNVRDPGTKNIIADWNQSGAITGQSTDAFYFSVYVDNPVNSVPFGEYRWESWDLPTYHERLKKNYAIVQEYFSTLP
ncbi:MAG TPA: family 2 glycosyl transferase [Clostridia bacterium]|nr:family 2 glycosyl transferase [Clostridia bacterium]